MGVKRSRLVRTLMAIPSLTSVIRNFHESWLDTKHNLDWNYLRNPASRRHFKAQNPPLNETQQEILQGLRQRGIAFSSFNDVFADSNQWERLRRAANCFADSEEVCDAVQAYREKSETSKGKNYLVRRFAGCPTIDANDPWLSLGLDARLLDLVNSYLGLWAKLLYVDVWYTIPISPGLPRAASQRWHRDPEDRKLLKLFLYLSEVNEGAGPLEYIPESCSGGRYYNLWRAKSGLAQPYPPQEKLENTIPPSQWVSGTGSIGTIVFCDTSGLHRGGYSLTDARLLATWAFVTPASLWPRRFKVGWRPGSRSLSAAAKFSIT